MGEDKSSVMEHGELGLIVLNGYEEIGKKVDNHIKAMRSEQDLEGSYIIPIDQVRFSNGEGKVRIRESVRGRDITSWRMLGTILVPTVCSDLKLIWGRTSICRTSSA